MNTGDTAFLLLSAALVMLMTPGLALFYGGMVRRKNTLGTIMQSMIVIALVSVEWLFVGYSLTFGPDVKGLIGDLSWVARGGDGRPHRLGGERTCRGPRGGEAPRTRGGKHGSPQSPDDRFGRGNPLVRLVRVQRGQRPGGGRPLHQRVCRDPYGGIGGDALLDVRGMGAPRQADRPGGGFRRGRRAGRHHPGGGLRRSALRHRHRRGCGGPLLRRGDDEGKDRL